MTEPIRLLHFADVHIGMENYGRTVLFDPATGIMTVKALNKTVKEL